MSDEQEQKKTERLHVLISPAELDAIDDWRFKNRLGTRAKAVRRLVQIGLRTSSEFEEIVRDASKAYHGTARLLKELTEQHQAGGNDSEIEGSLFEEVSSILKINKDIADTYIRILSLQQEIIHLNRPGDVELMIANAEASREKSKKYWDEVEKIIAQSKAEGNE